MVIGVEDEAARRVMREIYRPLERNGSPIVYTTRRTAELIKYAANVFLAMKVTFINEIADLCEKVGGDVMDVAHGVGLDKRIGRRFLNPGPGFGGSCFPKDTLALTKLAIEARSPMRLVETLVDVNEKRKVAMAHKIIDACGGSVKGKRIAVLGLTYKPNTDDMRDAPSLVIVPLLQQAGATIVAFDPEGAKQAAPLLPGVEFASGPYACLEGADALVVITEWDAFRALDLARVKAALRDAGGGRSAQHLSARRDAGDGVQIRGHRPGSVARAAPPPPPISSRPRIPSPDWPVPTTRRALPRHKTPAAEVSATA